MRISINATKIDGPWGGGANFASNLERYLTRRGHQVFRKLVPDLDIVLLTSVQKHLRVSSYSPSDAFDYRQLHPSAKVLLRVNACDEQRAVDGGTNRLMLAVARKADHTVFVSQFMRRLYQGHGLESAVPQSVILTGADETLFEPAGSRVWRAGEKLRIVTHHWSANVMKGYDFFERLDALLATEPYRGLFEFTYIGNVPFGLSMPRTRVLPPLSGAKLVEELKQHHVCLAGSRYEPGGNHYIESMQCGLPVAYLLNGGTPEYCKDAGLGFTPSNFEEVLLQLPQQYDRLRRNAIARTWNASNMCQAFESLFETVVESRSKVSTAPALNVRLGAQLRLLSSGVRRHVRNSRLSALRSHFGKVA